MSRTRNGVVVSGFVEAGTSQQHIIDVVIRYMFNKQVYSARELNCLFGQSIQNGLISKQQAYNIIASLYIMWHLHGGKFLTAPRRDVNLAIAGQWVSLLISSPLMRLKAKDIVGFKRGMVAVEANKSNYIRNS